MRIIYHLIVKELKQLMRDKRMRFLALAAPMIQLAVLGYAATTDVKSVPMVVCDGDRSSASRDFVSRFTNSGYFAVEDTVDSPNEIDRHIERGNAWLALVIPPSFSADVLARRTVKVQLIADGSDANSSNIAIGYATQIVNNYSQEILLEMLEKTPMASKPARVIPRVRVWYNESLTSRNFMVPGVVVLVLMIVTLTLTSMAVVREKEIGTMEQLLVTPIKPYQLILGKLIPYTLVGMVDVTFVLVISAYWFNVPIRGSVFLIYGMSCLFILNTLGIGLFISTIAQTQQQAMMIAQFGFFIPFMYFSGFIFPIENMPHAFQYVTYLIPLRYFLEIIRNIFLKGAGMDTLWPDALGLVVLGVTVLSVAILRFNKKLG